MEHLDRILLVDDDDSGRAMLALSLRRRGFDVDVASNGPAALGLLAGGNYGWLITDAQMTPMTGFELSTRAVALKPDLRVIMVSAIFQKGDIQGYPIEELFPKPLAPEALIARLEARPLNASAHLWRPG